MGTDPKSPPSVPYWRWLEQQLSELSTKLEHVVQRKIIGAFRSERGPRSYACIASLLEMWSYQGKDPYEELDALLRRELCLKE